eukprot:PhF_6_TR10365/c3_g3_i1/m.16090
MSIPSQARGTRDPVLQHNIVADWLSPLNRSKKEIRPSHETPRPEKFISQQESSEEGNIGLTLFRMSPCGTKSFLHDVGKIFVTTLDPTLFISRVHVSATLISGSSTPSEIRVLHAIAQRKDM